jgi:hypothetical protein
MWPRTRPIDAPAVRWVHEQRDVEHDGVALRWRPMATVDIAAVCALFTRHHPALCGSEAAWLRDPNFYRRRVALADADRDREIFAVVFEHRGTGEPICAAVYRMHRRDRSIEGLPVVIHREWRRRGLLARLYPECWLPMMQKTGADYYFSGVSTRDVAAQKLGLAVGMRMGGLMPGAELWTSDGVNYYRDTLVYMYMFLNGAEALCTAPAQWQIAEEALATCELAPLLRSAVTRRQPAG